MNSRVGQRERPRAIQRPLDSVSQRNPWFPASLALDAASVIPAVLKRALQLMS
jgi:hypothetical protein